MSRFSQAVVRIVRAVPRGRVVSYGQVAAYVGVPRAARQVGWTLRQLEGVDLPWWRVIGNAGRITIRGNLYHDAREQRQLLRGEGVGVDANFSLEMTEYRWLASGAQLRRWGLSAAYRQLLWAKYQLGY